MTRVLEIPERGLLELPAGDLALPEGELLHRHPARPVEVDFPSPKTGGRWRLRARGLVGHARISSGLLLRIPPKVGGARVFRMLAYACAADWRDLEPPAGCATLEGFHAYLARELARRALARSRRGYYRRYRPRQATLPYLRGRWTPARPGAVPGFDCEYAEPSEDCAENRLPYRALRVAAACLPAGDPARAEVAAALRSLEGKVSREGRDPPGGFAYGRLNADYRPMHALARFLLRMAGPDPVAGKLPCPSFLVDMDRLFEGFLQGWLSRHLPPGAGLRGQARLDLDPWGSRHYRVDLVLGEGPWGCVLDAKYKAAPSPALDDVNQALAYALAAGRKRAFLVYPREPERPLDAEVGGIKVASAAFPVDGDLDAAGRAFLARVLPVAGAALSP